MSSRGKFWIVLADENGTPTFRHPSLQSAQNEAERLARNVTDREFTVLESLATVMKRDVVWEPNDLDGSESESAGPF